MHTLPSLIVSGLSAVAAFVAAVLWWRASTLLVVPDQTPDASGWIPASITDETGSDPLASAREGSRWNAWAAIVAGVAAALQGTSTILGMYGL